MDRHAPRSAPPFGSSVKPQIWTDGGSSSASAAGGLMEQSGSNVVVTCRLSVRRRRTAASPSCQLVLPTRSCHPSYGGFKGRLLIRAADWSSANQTLGNCTVTYPPVQQSLSAYLQRRFPASCLAGPRRRSLREPPTYLRRAPGSRQTRLRTVWRTPRPAPHRVA